nr:hypothetical protein [Tanacetum cinerariifolium]
MDEALIPRAKRLRIGRSNFRLLSDIKSKESTLQLVYDVLPTVHHHSIRFKMDNKKHIVNLESFREMLHICPRLPHQPFVKPPFEEEILAFLCFHRHSGAIRKLTDVEHRDTKKSNEMYYPRFTKVIIHHFMSKDSSIPRRNKVNWHYVRDDHMFTTIKNSNAYKEYYAVATGATPPKPKASVRKTRSSFDTTITPPTTAAGPRLTTSKKGKQAAKASKAKSLSALSEVAMTEEEISWNSTGDDDEGKDGDGDDDDDGDNGEEGDGDDDYEDDNGEEGNDDDDQEDEGDDEEKGNDDEQASNEEEFIHSSLSTHTKEETRDEESFDPIPKTPEDTDDEGNGEENLGINVGREEGHDEEEEEDELYRHVNINQGRGMESIYETTSQIDVKDKVKVQVSKFLPKIEQTVNEKLEAEVLTRSSNSSKTSYAVAADLSEMELKNILIKKIEGNKDVAMMMLIKTKKPSAGSDKGSKRRREGKEPNESATAEKPMQTTFEMEEPSHLQFETGADDQPIIESSQHLEWFSQQKKPPTPDHDWNKTLSATHRSIQPWISELAKQSDSRSSFNELMDTPVDFSNFLINRLKVDTLTLELLAGPTYELMKGSCKSLVELEFFLEEVYKATTDQLDWVNPKEVPQAASIQLLSPRQRIIVVTELKIVEWHNYKHLYWTTIRRDDDKLYMFMEGDFKRQRIQDIEDMLLLLVQGNLTNLTVEECFAFNNKDKQNRLMRIDELHKFNDGTLTDVRTTLDDRLKGIQRKYLPQSIWRKSDKDRVSAMIQAIDKRLKTRKIMRSLERYQYDKRSKSEYMGIVPTEMELILEHTQQGISHEVSKKDDVEILERVVTDINKGTKSTKLDKTEHKRESVEKSKVNQSQQKVNPDKVKAKRNKSWRDEIANFAKYTTRGLKMAKAEIKVKGAFLPSP